MKMKKFAAALASLSLMAALAGCGAENEMQDPSAQDGTTYTGILEEKKDFMIIVSAPDGSEAYGFNLEGVTCDAEVGDTVVVTYTGDLEDFDAQLTATKITLAE